MHPGVEYKEVKIKYCSKIELSSWNELLFLAIVNKCKGDACKNLLQFRYGADIANKLIGSSVTKVIVGVVIGAAVVAGIGFLGIPAAAPAIKAVAIKLGATKISAGVTQATVAAVAAASAAVIK